MPRCAGRKPSGEPCERIVGASQEYCYAHDPARKAERRRNASKAGKKSSGSAEIKDLKKQLEDLTRRVLGDAGPRRLETARAAVANQLINTRLRAIEQERKIRETEELEGRIEALEEQADTAKGGKRWGA